MNASLRLRSFVVKSFYTKEQFKAYKSLEAYNFLGSGFLTSIQGSIVAILVQYCRTDTTREWLDTTCTTRTTRTGRETMVYGSYRSWINGDMHIISNTALQPRRYTRTTRETMVHESYNNYW